MLKRFLLSLFIITMLTSLVIAQGPPTELQRQTKAAATQSYNGCGNAKGSCDSVINAADGWNDAATGMYLACLSMGATETQVATGMEIFTDANSDYYEGYDIYSCNDFSTATSRFTEAEVLWYSIPANYPAACSKYLQSQAITDVDVGYFVDAKPWYESARDKYIQAYNFFDNLLNQLQ